MQKQRQEGELKVVSFVKQWKGRSDYLSQPEILAQALADYEDILAQYGPAGSEWFYFYLKQEQNQVDPNIKARFTQVDDFEKKWSTQLTFFPISIAQLPLDKQKSFLAHPSLKKYHHFLERKFQWAPHYLSEAEEKIMTLKSSSSHSQWVKMIAGLSSKEQREVFINDTQKETKNFSEILSLVNSTNKKVRDSAAEAWNDILRQYVSFAEAELNAILGNKKVDDDLRKMPRPDSARHLADDIDSKIVDTLVEAVSQRFVLSQRFYRLQAALLGVPQLEYHERNVPYGSVEKKYSYEDSVALVHKVFSQLDPSFGVQFKQFVDQGRIDVFPRAGKKSGAFCTYGLRKDPVFILLNHTDRLQDVLTIAHEAGHGINFELMKQQSGLDYSLSLATAEVASTFMEDFVLQALEQEADDELRLSLMMMKLKDDMSTIFRQTACYLFEQELHTVFRAKGYVSKEEIGTLFQKHMSSYMGDAVEQSPGSENWWVYWGQIRRFFYNYSYASGLLISKAMQSRVKKDKQFISQIKTFLSAGMSESPHTIFLRIGIDINKKEFWNTGLDEIEHLLHETETLAKQLGKI